MISRDLKHLDILSEEQLRQIDEATHTVLEKNGIEFMSSEARELLQNNGAGVEGNKVFFPSKLVDEKLKLAPSEFTLHARNPAKNVVVGGKNTVMAPGYGSPFVMDYASGKRRNAMYEDYISFTRLAGWSDHLDVVGGVLVEPNDIPDKVRHIKMFHAAAKYTDKCHMGSAMGAEKAQDSIEMASIIHGGMDYIKNHPVLITLINSNSPLQFDGRMLDAMMVYAKHGQPVLISSLSMTGTTAPATVASALVQQNAEILAGIVLAQCINPGTPVVYGSASSVVDLRTGNLAIGSPESVKMFAAVAQLARFYGVPSRGGGSLTDSILTDAQSGYESQMVFLTSVLSGFNFILHSAGLLENYMTMSYEKFILDDEVVGMVRNMFRGIDVNKDTLGLDTLLRVGSGGNFIADPHTYQHMRDMRVPLVSSRIGYASVGEDTSDAAQRAHQYALKVLDEYESPALDGDIEKGLLDFLESKN
jgi:trimethylamine--corrinoid protein Co-methyltransferase